MAIAPLADGGYIIAGVVGPYLTRKLLLIRTAPEQFSSVEEDVPLPLEMDLSEARYPQLPCCSIPAARAWARQLNDR
jgi:hypothetical protein